MLIEFDASKREITLKERGLDFTHADKLFAGITVTMADARRDYGEARWLTMGQLEGREVILVWTPRGAARRIISMRYANEREIARYRPGLG